MSYPEAAAVGEAPIRRAKTLLRRPVSAGILLLLVYLGLSLLNSPNAYLGTDTGGKVATLEAMTSRPGLNPDVGYWARDWDPEGRLHPFWYTHRFGDKWVQLSTVPMTYAAKPFYEVGGYRFVLLFPMVGAVAAAFAARAMARRLTETDGWAAFWLVGLVSPLLLYALDFWEHSIGVALIGWGVVVYLDAAFPAAGVPRPWPSLTRLGLLGGLLFGSAATMRTEALVYVVVATGITCLHLLRGERKVARSLVFGATAVFGALFALVLNAVLEVATLGSTMRAGRNATVAASPAGDLATRAKEAIVTGLSLHPSLDPQTYLLAFALLVLMVFVVWRAASGRDQVPAKIAAGAIVVLYVLRLADGPGFVPGLLAATPIAAVGLVLAWSRPRQRFVALVALLSLPLVWLFQFPGGAAPQWAGRYILPTGFLLLVVGVTQLPRLAVWAQRFFVGLAVVVTLFGMVWMVQRTHQMATAQQQLAARSEPVLVSTVAHLAREGGGYTEHERWLTATNVEDQDLAARVVRDAGFDEFGLVVLDESGAAPEPREIPGFTASGSDRVPLFSGIDLLVTTYSADD